MLLQKQGDNFHSRSDQHFEPRIPNPKNIYDIMNHSGIKVTTFRQIFMSILFSVKLFFCIEAVCGDGEFTIYSAIKIMNKAYGAAL